MSSKLNMSLDEVIKADRKPRAQKKTPAKKTQQKGGRKTDNDNTRAPKQNVARNGQRNQRNVKDSNQRNARVATKTPKSNAAQKVQALKSTRVAGRAGTRGAVKILRPVTAVPANNRRGAAPVKRLTIQARVVPGSQILLSGINKNITEAELKPVFAALGKLTFFAALKADGVPTGKYTLRYADAKTAKNVVSTYNNGTIAGSKVSLTIDN